MNTHDVFIFSNFISRQSFSSGKFWNPLLLTLLRDILHFAARPLSALLSAPLLHGRTKNQHQYKEGKFNNFGSVSDAGRGLHGTLTVSPPFKRKQVVHQLLAGDLADLADEGLYQLLPSGSQTVRAGNRKNTMSQLSVTLAKPKQQTKNPSLRKSQTNRFVGKLGMEENTLCFTSLEHQLRQSHAESELSRILRDLIYPELNLKSYLDCKSDLALPTIRHILSRRPTDEALELDRSLTKALMNPRKTSPATKDRGSRTKHGSVSVQQKPPSRRHPHPWLLPMEWED